MNVLYSFLNSLWNDLNFKIDFYFIVSYLFGLSIILLAYFQPYVPIAELTRDTIAITQGKVYYGLISNIGLFMWCATSTLCLFTLLIVKNRAAKKEKQLLIGGAMISSLLLLDDFLLLHEAVFPLSFGINEIYIIILYPMFIGGYIFLYFREIIKTQCLLFFFSLLFLMFSMISDNLFSQKGDIIIIEDGFKFLGIVGWLLYFIHFCKELVNKRLVTSVKSTQNVPLNAHKSNLSFPRIVN